MGRWKFAQRIARMTAAFAVGASALCSSTGFAKPQPAPSPDPRIAVRVMQLTRATQWTPVSVIKVRFKTFHPQGMVRIGGIFYVSSVEVIKAPKKLAPPADGHDRDPGEGVGHLFKIGADGTLLADLILGEGSIYHPGGIDFDGASIWVPTSEYRPDSRAIIYRVDPATMKAKAVFRFDDHIGGVAYDRTRNTLHGVSWGSRRFYAWPIDGQGGVRSGARVARAPNPEQYIDYQDCHFVGGGRMLCSGLGQYAAGPDAKPFALGGIDLVDLKDNRPIWQVPIELRSPTGRPMTQNPFFVEATAKGLRAWFMPDDDDDSTLFAFDAAIP